MKQKFSHSSIMKFDEKMNKNTDDNTNVIETNKSLNKIKWLNNDTIAITGISGRYPESDNIEEFWDKLMNGIPLYTCDDRRWPVDFLDIPKNQGKLKDISKVDASFFNIKPFDANFMDPQIRLLYEVVYEAIFDAGIDPADLRGSRTGLFLGMCYDDTHAALLEDECYKEFISVFSVSRISYAFDFKGPTTTIDTACASSLSAFHQALCSIKSGQSDQCIVAGVAIHLRPAVSFAFHNLKMLSDDGKSKCLDAAADGYCRSEGVVALLLQREKDSRRIYAKVVNSATNCDGYKQEGITFPKCEAQAKLMQEVYSGCSIDPLEIDYIEAHMTGTAAGDPVESKAITTTLRPNKSTKTIMFGCLKSNMGHTEGASGVCSLSKVCKIFQTGFIPPNINFINPNPFIEELISGIIQPVIKVTPFSGKYIGINSFGFGGANVHMIVEKNNKSLKDDNNSSYNISDKLPRLINICNRTQEGIIYTFEILESNKDKLSRDYLALLNKVSKIEPSSMNYRGYMIVDKDGNNSNKILSKSYEKIDSVRPLWFVFSPLGCQWKSMGSSLLKFPIFKKRIDQLNDIMKKYSLNLIDIITTSECKDIISTLLGITSIQIGIVDILRDLNIYPQGIIGHSIGEVSAAYADNCLTAEQAILTSYWIAKICKSAQKDKGSMASIGLSYNELKNLLPHGIDAACINSLDNVTISGNKDKINKFILEMNDKNIFAKPVNSCGIAYHSSSIQHARETLNKKFAEFITNPKKRSKWLSCAVPFSKWDRVEIADSSYFANMTVDTVYFTDAIEHSNKDALFVEISPNAILLSLIKRNSPTSKCIGIMKKNPDNSSEENISLLNSIGKIFSSGYNPSIEKLYPKVTFPIACETPTLGHLIKWDHSNTWKITKYPEYFSSIYRDLKYNIDLLAEQFRYLTGHVIDGRTLFPATGYLHIVWKQIATVIGVQDTNKLPIIFENVQLYRATILNPNSSVTLFVNYDQHTNKFVFLEGDSICVTGFAYVPSDHQPPKDELEPFIHSPEKLVPDKSKSLTLTSKEVYRELRLRGYDYGLTFQGVTSASTDGTCGKVKYDRNWVCFADSMMQITILASHIRQLCLPTYIEYLRCDPEILQNEVKKLEKEGKEPILDVYFDRYSMIGATKGLVVKGLKATSAPRKVNNQNPMIEEQLFLPLDCTINEDIIETKNYEEYIELCNLCLKKSYQQNDKIKDMLSREQDEHSLLRLLSTNELDNLMKNITQSYEQLSEDIIFTRGVRKLLRSQIDIIAENLNSNKIFVTEINSTSQLFFDEIIKIFNTYAIRTQITLVHPEGSPSKGAKSIMWPTNDDFNIVNLEKSDLIVFKDDRTEFLSNKYPLMPFKALLNKSYSTLNNGGFMVIFYRKSLSKIEENISIALSLEKISFNDLNDLEQIAREIGFTHISKLVFDNWESLLLRKLNPEQENTKNVYITSDNFSWLDELKEYINDDNINRLWLIGNDPLSGVIGLVNCLRKEPLGYRIRCFYSVDGKSQLTDEIIKKDLAINCSNNNITGTYRYFIIDNDDPLVISKHNFLNVKVRGDLSSLKWFQCQYDNWSSIPKQITGVDIGIIDVYYSAINFKDIMVATGRISTDAYPKGTISTCYIGMEYSGVYNGLRIMGVLENQALATTILQREKNFQFEVPDNWTLEEAATVPVVYLTGKVIIDKKIKKAKLRSGESILIHAGSGGVGQAAISVCLARGVKVYTTVGTQAKRNYLKSKFPQLQDSDISNSRTIEFEDHIMTQTNGRGVDIVLNSLAEDKFQASVRCLAHFGRFVEIGKYDILQNTPIEPLDDNKTLHSVCLAHLMYDIFKEKSPAALELHDHLINLMLNGLKNGEIIPLDRKVFERSQAEEAFRFMATGKHIGKVLLKLRDENEVQVDRPLTAIGQTYFDPMKSYIVTGGLGGVGLELVNWMILRGAINITITSRTGVKNNYQKIILDRLMMPTYNGFKVKINVLVNEGLTYEANEELIDEASKLGPIGGIFHLSMILHDAILPNQTIETFEKVCAPKIKTAIYLDAITRRKCPSLDYFVCFSSAASGKGNAGQSNYAFANSTLDRICDQRKKQGFHGLSIQWGAIGDVGVVAEMGGNDIILGGTLPQRIISCMETLDKFLQLSKNPLNQKIYSFNVGSTEISSSFSVCSSIVLADSKKMNLGGKDNLLRTICHILGVKDHNTLDPNTTLSDLGLDSLMAVEIKQALERDYDIIFSTQEIRNLRIKDINELGKKVVTKNKDLENDIPIMINPRDLFLTISNLAGKPILFLPPIEGDFKLMIPLTKHITRPVTGINWTEDFDNCKDLRQVACLLADRIRCHLPNTNEFDMVGYSFGGIVAIELGLRLQELLGENSIKRIILLDTSPEYLKHQIIKLGQKTNIIEENEAELEALIGYVGSFITIDNVNELRLTLHKLNKEERIEKMSHFISTRGIKCEPDDLIAAFKRFTHKMRLIYNYKVTKTLNADITLIRCKEWNFNPSEVNFDDDYGLNKLVNGRIEVIQYAGNHKTFLSQNIDDISTLLDARLNIVGFA